MHLFGRDDGNASAVQLSGGIVNGTCTKERTTAVSPPLFQHGDIAFQAHDVGWIVCAFFSLVATFASFWLIGKHLRWYTNKREQRHIVRILLMVPLYAWVSFGSYVFWNHATPLLLLRDCYESTVLTAFFYLLLIYLSPDPHVQRDVLRRDGLSREHDRELARQGLPPKKWAFPLHWVKAKPADGLFFLQAMKWGVLQYCVLRPLTTLASVVLDYMGIYCESSYSPRWGHIYLTAIVSISVSIAMYCLLQFYFCTAERLKPKEPLLKLVAIKAVVFLTFWQSTALGFLITFGLIKNTPYMTADDINTGIAALLETFEMMIFAFVHIRAFSYRPYKPAPGPDGAPPTPTPRLRAFMHALDFRETVREVWAGARYMGAHARGREDEADRLARRAAMLGHALGKERAVAPAPAPAEDAGDGFRHAYDDPWAPAGAGAGVHVRRDTETFYDGGARAWLGADDPYRGRREKSEALGEQIERELRSKGYSMRNREPSAAGGHQYPRSSWWRRAYGRFSHRGSEVEPVAQADEHAYGYAPPELAPRARGGRSRSRTHRADRRARESQDPLVPALPALPDEYDDPPPRSLIRAQGYAPAPELRVQVPPRGARGHIVDPRYQEALASPESPPPRRAARVPAHLRTPPGVEPAHLDSDSVFGRVFPPSDSGAHSYAHGGALPSPPAHRASLGYTPQEKRWTFGADGRAGAGALSPEPPSPVSPGSRASAFHTARETPSLGDSSRGSRATYGTAPSTADRRRSYDMASVSAATDSSGPTEEFGHRRKPRRVPAEYTPPPFAPRPAPGAVERELPPPPTPRAAYGPLSPPRARVASPPAGGGMRSPPGAGSRAPYAMPRHTPRQLSVPAPLAPPPTQSAPYRTDPYGSPSSPPRGMSSAASPPMSPRGRPYM